MKPTSDYVLRISLPKCNLRCIYCRKSLKGIPKKSMLSEKELLDIIRAAYENGITRIRWTGGEPTVNLNFIKIVKKVKEIGINEQYLSTNGTILWKIAKSLSNAGITRVNISLDTLNREKFKKIAGLDLLPDVLKSIDTAVKIFKKIKINTVLTRKSYQDVGKLINFVASITKKNKAYDKVAIRFIELICGGFKGDKKYVRREYLLGKEVIKKIKKEYGEIIPTKFEGDNPMCYYFKIKNNKVIFGVIPHYSVHFRCGGKRCKKLRLNPQGVISNCSIHKKFGHDLKNTSYEEKLGVLNHLIKEKMERTEEDFSKLKHFQSDYSFWRFGITAEKKIKKKKKMKH